MSYDRLTMNHAVVTGAFVLCVTSIAPFDLIRAQVATGAIAGRMTFTGTPPPAVALHDGGSQKVLHIDRSGGLQYAVVFLPDLRGASRPPAAPATLNQRHFVFEPQVVAVRAGQIVRFTNDDPANHNVRAQDANAANTFSINTAAGAAGPDTRRFVAMPPGMPLELSCDIHPWMAAWIYVFDHDYFAVTKADGSFRIENVPAGRYRVAVRQPAGRLARDLAVDVRTGQAAQVDVRFTQADIGIPSR